uniref:DUF4614 domain-containing protein n=1 Tax=Macrostomum lignano TaxID=282301 RepID=A0A1I8F206_9PLAT
RTALFQAIPTRASTSKLLERTSRQLRGDYRRQSAETEEAQLNDFLQEVRQQTTLSTEVDRKAKPQQQPQRRRKKVHLGSDVSDVSVTSSSSGGARAAAGSRFLKSKTVAPSSSKQQPQQPPPKPQPSSAPPKRTSSQQQPQQPQQSAPGRHSAVLDKASRLTSQRPQQQQQAAASRKARLQPTAAEAIEAEDETRHQLYRHRASLDFLSESESHSIGQDGARFLRRTTDATPQRQQPPPPAEDPSPANRQQPQPPLTPKSPKQLRTTRDEDEETHSGQADRLVIRHRPPVPPIELNQDSSIGEAVVRKPALKKSSSFSDIQGGDAAGLLETSRQFDSIDTDDQPTRRSGDTFAPLGDSVDAANLRHDDDQDEDSSSSDSKPGGQNVVLDFEQLSAVVADADDQDNDEEDEDGDGDRFGIVKDVDDIEEDLEYDRSVAEEISTAEASDKYDSDFETEAAPTYTQDFDDFDGGEATDRGLAGTARLSGAAAGIRTASPRRRLLRHRRLPARRDRRSERRFGGLAAVAAAAIERRAALPPPRVRRPPPPAAAAAAATAVAAVAIAVGVRVLGTDFVARHRRRIRDVEVQTQPEGTSLRPGGGLGYQWDPAGVGQAAAAHGLGLGSVDPTPVASLAVSADALEAVTAYSPASAALNSLVRDQLALTAAFLASQRRIYQGAVEALRGEPTGRNRYTTLQDTLYRAQSAQILDIGRGPALPPVAARDPGAPPHPQQPAMSFGVGGSNGTAGSRRRSRSHSRHRDLKQPPAPTPQQLTVTLSRAPDFGLGIAVSGGIDSLPVDGGGGGDRGDEAGGLFISDIIQGGPAEGRLRIGDRLLACNGVSLRRATHDAAVAELQRSHAVRLLIERRPPARLGNGADDDDDDSAGSDDADDLPGENNGAGRSAIDLENDETGEDGAGGSSLLVHVTFVVRSPDLLNSQLVVSKSLDRSLSLQFRQEPQQLSPERLGNGQHRAEPVQLPAPSQHRLEPPPQPSIGAGRHRSVEALAPPPHAPTDAEQVRQVTPDPDGSIGVRLDGGNAVGIFVRQVRFYISSGPGGPADRAGVRPGDRLVAVDRRSLVRATKEEALLALLPQSMPPRPLRLSVLPDPAGYRAFASGRQPGDRFHVRAHFNHAKPAPNEAVIRRGDVFLVQDTLAGGVVGAWEAVRVHPPPAEAAVSLIPNQFRAEQLAMAAAAAGRDLATAFPPYERVALRRAAFPRPVVVFGPFADFVRRHLLDSLPEKFELPPQTAQ